jgi:hypothetical protein
MIRRPLAALTALAFSHVAYAQQTQSTINPNEPAQNGAADFALFLEDNSQRLTTISTISWAGQLRLSRLTISPILLMLRQQGQISALGALAILNTLPVPGASTLGGVKSVTCSTAQVCQFR